MQASHHSNFIFILTFIKLDSISVNFILRPLQSVQHCLPEQEHTNPVLSPAAGSKTK